MAKAKDFYEYDNYITAREQKNYTEKHLLKALRALSALLVNENGTFSTGEMIPRDLVRAKHHMEMAYYILTCESDLGDEGARDWYARMYAAKKEE